MTRRRPCSPSRRGSFWLIADGEREVALADYFTGYRQSVCRRDELIRAIRIPLPLAPLSGIPQDRQAPVRRHFQRRDRLRARGGGTVVRKARIGLGGVAAMPIRALETEAALEGQPWTAETAHEAGALLRREGTPHRRPSGQRRVPGRRCWARACPSCTPSTRTGREEAAMTIAAYDHSQSPLGRRPMSALSERPERATVGLTIPHESAALHVTGDALYTDDLVLRTKDVLHAYPVQVTHAPRPGHRAAHRNRRCSVPGVVRVLTAADVPGVNDAGVKHDEPLFPDEIMFYGHAVCWVLGETARGGPARSRRRRGGRTTPLPSFVTVGEAIAAQRLPGRAAAHGAGRRRMPRWRTARTSSAGEFEFSGQEHFYLETHAALAMVDEAGQIFVQSSTQHPSETQEIVAHVLGRRNHEVTVQCLRMGGGFGGKEMQPHGFAAIAALGATLTGRPVRLRLNRTQDLTMSGKRHGFHADWRVGFDERRAAAARSDATLTADGGWSLDLSEPVLARALCHIDNAYWIPNVRVNGRIAKTNKTSQTAFRGFGGPQGMLVIEDILGRVRALLGVDPAELRRRNFYQPARPRRTASRFGTLSGSPTIWQQVLDSADVARRGGQRSPALQPQPTSTSSAAWP